MYLSYYGFNKGPFHITPDPEFLFLSPTHKEALGAIIYGIEQRKGFVAITGEAGVGKTTILRSYLEGQALPHTSKKKVIYVFNANLSFQSLLKVICSELGVVPKTEDAFKTVNELHKTLIEEYKQGNNVVLILDEAQNVPVETLENLRMLSNLETSKEKLIQMILIGQPEFQAKLGLDKLRQLNQRIAIRSNIVPLSREESIMYIRHRLSLVTDRWDGVFTRRAMDLIVDEAKGIPRVINILCDNTLIAGLGYQAKPVGRRIVREVIADYKGRRRMLRLRWGIALAALLVLAASALLLAPVKGFLPEIRAFRDRAVSTVSDAARMAPVTGTPTRMPVPVDAAKPEIPQTGNAEVPKNTPTVEPQPRLDQSASAQTVSAPPPVRSEAYSGAVGVAGAIIYQPAGDPPVTADQAPSVFRRDESAPTRAIEVPSRIIKRGETLSSIIRDTYGVVNAHLFELIRQNNPQITDADRILAGGQLFLPRISQSPERAEAAVPGVVR